MGGSNQSKSAYNQSRSMQNWYMDQYQRMFGPNGAGSATLSPVGKAGNQLLSLGGVPQGVRQDINANENNALGAINQGANAAQRQAASNVASIYSNLYQNLMNQRRIQGGYMPGFGASSEDMARNAAEEMSLSAIAPEEQRANQLQNQYNQNILNSLNLGTMGLQGTQLGAQLSSLPLQTQLQALGLTEGDINNAVSTQGSIGSNIASPLQNISSIMNIGRQAQGMLTSL